MMKANLVKLAMCAALSIGGTKSLLAGELETWNDTLNQSTIVEFVTSVADETSGNYIPPQDRIAVFDNDGTLWAEKPAYVEVVFVVTMVQTLADRHPEWKELEPFAAILEDGMGALRQLDNKSFFQVLATVYSELGAENIQQHADRFLAAEHPTLGTAFAENTYSPMVELMDYLRDNDFRVFIVSGGTNTFMRTFASEIYGVAPQNVIGTSLKKELVIDDQGVQLRTLPNIEYFNNGATKVTNVARTLGVQPVIAVGNSDGDLPMIKYTLGGDGPRLGLLVVHDDEDREFAYENGAEKALEAAAFEDDNFLTISMKEDFKRIWTE